jgi:hypothetical protein
VRISTAVLLPGLLLEALRGWAVFIPIAAVLAFLILFIRSDPFGATRKLIPTLKVPQECALRSMCL